MGLEIRGSSGDLLGTISPSGGGGGGDDFVGCLVILLAIVGTVIGGIVWLWLALGSDGQFTFPFNYLSQWYYWVLKVPLVAAWDLTVYLVSTAYSHDLTQYPNLNMVLGLVFSFFALVISWAIVLSAAIMPLFFLEKHISSSAPVYLIFLVYIAPLILAGFYLVFYWLFLIIKGIFFWLFAAA